MQQPVCYSQKAATKQALVAQATINATFHCLAEAQEIHPRREREGLPGGQQPLPLPGALTPRLNWGARGEDVGPLAKNSPLLVTHVWSGLFLDGWDGTSLTWLCAQMSAIIGHPLLARSWVGSLTPLQGAEGLPCSSPLRVHFLCWEWGSPGHASRRETRAWLGS